MHIHFGLVDLAKTIAVVLLAGTFIRIIELMFHDTAFGQALAFMY